MRTVIVNANIVIPHEDRILKDSSLVIENGVIHRINENVKYRFDYDANKVVDAEGGYLIPGMINHHSHGFTLAPLNPSAGKPASLELVFRNLDRHLLQGTTSLLNLDGFALPEEVEIINKLHPIKVKTGATHTPLNIKAAQVADGAGLTEIHRTRNLEDMLELGAIAIGEIGAGSTLGGGAASYLLLPRAIERITSKLITPAQSLKIMTAVLGRYIDPVYTDRNQVRTAIEEAGLRESLSVDKTIDLVREVVFSPVEIARSGIKEAAEFAMKYNVPVIIHNATGSVKSVLEVAQTLGPKLIAAHSNHPSFERNEMFEYTSKLKECGAIIDICVGDGFNAQQLFSADHIGPTIDLLCEYGDLISTDFMGGNWDPILILIDRVVKEKRMSIPRAIGMGSYNVVKAIPKIAPNSGTIDVGKAGDVVRNRGLGVKATLYTLLYPSHDLFYPHQL